MVLYADKNETQVERGEVLLSFWQQTVEFGRIKNAGEIRRYRNKQYSESVSFAEPF